VLVGAHIRGILFKKANKNLIATTPYSEFATTSSQQRSRHFLTATKPPFPVRRTFAHNWPHPPSSSVDSVTLWQYTVTGSEVKQR
jgi:hypothetical protein